MGRLIAMDVHKASNTCAVWDGHDLVQEPTKVSSSREALLGAVRAHPGALVVVEACGFHELVHDILAQEGTRVRAFVPPRREPGEKKNDAKDALRLGRRFLAGDLREAWIAPAGVRELRDLVRYRQRVVETRTAEMNVIQHALNRKGASVFNPFTKASRETIVKRFPLLNFSYETMEMQKQTIKSLTRLVEAQGDQIPAVRRLQTIPGFGRIVSLVFYAEIGDVHRFPSADHVVSYFGLDPAWGQSGERAWDLHHITHEGRAYVRGVLNEAAWAHVNHAPESDITKAHHVYATKKSDKLAIVKTTSALVKAAYRVWKEDRDFTMNRPARFAPCRVPAKT